MSPVAHLSTNKELIISIAADHRGFKLKEKIKAFLLSGRSGVSCKVKDEGSFSEDPADYPDFAKIVAGNVSAQKSQFGVLVCGSGIGTSIAANRFRRVRAALCRTIEETALSRAHNNANVLVLGSGIENDSQLVEGILKTFFTTQFEGGRHQRRVEKIDE